MLHSKKHIELYAYLFDLHISLHLEQFDVIFYVGYGYYSIYPNYKVLLFRREIVESIVFKCSVDEPFVTSIEEPCFNFVDQVCTNSRSDGVEGNHECAFRSKVPCSKSWFFYINDEEMDNLNKGGQRSSSMLSYG
jgi:hypothetical protein